MELRNYQSEAVAALWKHIQTREDNPCIVLPTGAGKGVVMAQIAKDVVGKWKGRIAIVAHVRELLTQTAENITRMAPEIGVGIYSAGLKARDLGYPVTVAGIQSIYDKAEQLGPVDIIAIDEAHRIPPDGEGQYRTFLDAAKKLNPNVRLVGLTATPYRMSTGMICGRDQILNQVCYEIGVRKLIVDGYLSPLRSKATVERTDVSKVSVRGGEYVAGELQAAMVADQDKVILACSEIDGKTSDRKSVIVFCTGIDHATLVANFLRDIAGDQVRTVFGDTPDEERARTIADFKAGRVKFLVNVDVLTTGFDAPGVDAVAILRPTLSPGLFYQMVGRGFRLAPAKKDCLVLDFGDNLFRHGPVDRMVITEDRKTGQVGNGGARFKECPKCSEVLPWSCEVCPDCGEKIPRAEPEVTHGASAADKEALSEPEAVAEIVYKKHEKANNPEKKPPTLRVEYYCGLMHTPTEYVCLEHTGFARTKAASWWRARSSEPLPATIDQALEVIRTKGIKEPKKVTLISERGYLKPEKYHDLTFNATPSVLNGIERDMAEAFGDPGSSGGIDFAKLLKSEAGKPGTA